MEDSQKQYGVIIIGAGMTGLSTGLAWANTLDIEEHPVLILEKQPVAGGCVTTFARSGYRFDTVQIIPEIGDLLSFYGIEMDLQPYTPVYARLFLVNPADQSTKIIPVASGKQEFQDQLSRSYPEDAEAVSAFFSYGQALLDELVFLKTEPRPADILNILRKCPKLIRNSGKTYRQYLDSFGFKNRELVEVLDLFSSFSALSGDRCAALLTACAMMTTLEGAWRPSGGFIQFPRLLGDRFKQLGGEIRTGIRADEILLKNGKAAGVRCGDRIFRSGYVVSTADSFKTFGELLPAGAVKSGNRRFSRKAAKAAVAPSSFTVHLGLDDRLDLKSMGFDCGYNVLTTGRTAHEAAFRCWNEGKPFDDPDQFHLAVISPSAVIGGKNTLIIHVNPEPMGEWETLRNTDYPAYLAEKEERASRYIRLVEKYMIPDLTEHILLTDIATPATYARYIGSTQGANSDMLAVPGNFGKNRLPTRTPVKNLFVPKFSQGIWPSLQAGLQVVDMITGGAIMNGSSRYSGQDSFYGSL